MIRILTERPQPLCGNTDKPKTSSIHHYSLERQGVFTEAVANYVYPFSHRISTQSSRIQRTKVPSLLSPVNPMQKMAKSPTFDESCTRIFFRFFSKNWNKQDHDIPFSSSKVLQHTQLDLTAVPGCRFNRQIRAEQECLTLSSPSLR
jgi:hypothetical protein